MDSKKFGRMKRRDYVAKEMFETTRHMVHRDRKKQERIKHKKKFFYEDLGED